MNFAIVDHKIVDAREHKDSLTIVGSCVRCGRPVVLSRNCDHYYAYSWIHVDSDDAIYCQGNKDEKLHALLEKLDKLEDENQHLRSEVRRLARYES